MDLSSVLLVIHLATISGLLSLRTFSGLHKVCGEMSSPACSTQVIDRPDCYAKIASRGYVQLHGDLQVINMQPYPVF